MKLNIIKALPLLLASVLTVNLQAQEKTVEVHEESVAILIPNNASDADLKKIAKEFTEEGITLKISKVRRNKEGVITGIHIEAKRKTEGNSVSSSYSNTGDTPLKSIKISYDSNGGLNINSGGNTHMTKIHNSTKDKNGNFVFVSDDGMKKKIKISSSSNNHVFISSDHENSKIIVNGKEMTKDELEKMDKDNIKTIEIESEKYMDHSESDVETEIRFKSPKDYATLYFVDGKEVKSVEHIGADSIEAIYVLKGKAAVEKYGKRGANGVVEIIMKK